MFVTVMKSKLQNAIVTQADLYYEGSITIDEELMERANIVKGERVQIVNLNNGERLETYTIVGERSSGVIGMNGPAALKCKKGDQIHIISYAMLDAQEVENFEGVVLFLGEKNTIQKKKTV